MTEQHKYERHEGQVLPGSDLKMLLTVLKIYVTRGNKFVTLPRDIFKNNVITHKNATEAKGWSAGAHIKYWPQQFNFAVWCATAGCGVSFDHLSTPRKSALPPQIRSLLRFHVYFTIRSILHEVRDRIAG